MIPIEQNYENASELLRSASEHARVAGVIRALGQHAAADKRLEAMRRNIRDAQRLVEGPPL